ncbi:unnamed protein product [Polarella glacialis]|uniref:Ion transport domain-containing protein n=1 Tax=Polarella glacialis TaxID=89957 RepID=A0A813I895_POLGL|nr:unnamed protein product [Polarella glacialis]
MAFAGHSQLHSFLRILSAPLGGFVVIDCGWSVCCCFFENPEVPFGIFRGLILAHLLVRTSDDYSLDLACDAVIEPNADQNYGNSYERGLLGLDIMIQAANALLLLKNACPATEFSRTLLSIVESFLRLWIVLAILIFVFFALVAAFFVMESRLDYGDLFEKVYRGIFLADGAGLDSMECGDGDQKELDVYMTLGSTFAVTICILNVSIAIFTSEYEYARQESWLRFWKWRARRCAEAFLSPTWPWALDLQLEAWERQ